MSGLKMQIGMIVTGLIVIVIGLSLAPTILSTAATTGANTQINSFSGSKALNDLVPLIYFVVIVATAVGFIGFGAAGIYRKSKGGM